MRLQRSTSLFLTAVASALILVKPFSIINKAHTFKKLNFQTVTQLSAVKEKGKDVFGGEGVPEYKNAATSILSNFMQGTKKDDTPMDEDVFLNIDFNAEKMSAVGIATLSECLDAELYKREWFVTGDVNPVYFANSFRFQDPDVKLDGIENYARSVRKLFNQETSRAEIISTEVVLDPRTNEVDGGEGIITVTWRLSGNVNIGPFPGGLRINPYIVRTDFTVDGDSGLITLQEDRFDVEQWDILLSALFPFLVGKITSEPAPPVLVRDVEPVMPKLTMNDAFSTESVGDFFANLFGQFIK